MISPPSRHIYSVSALTAEVKAVLEDGFSAIWVEGELSNFKHHTSGHMYFTLKDAQAQIRGVMFRGHNRLLRFQPTDGLAVLVCGAVTVYERRGEYQITAEFMEPKGVGALQLAFEQLKAKLAADPDVNKFNIDVDVLQGVVTLSGTVETDYARQHAEEIASRTKGVTGVKNLLKVEP